MNKNLRSRRWVSISLALPAIALAGGLLGAQPSSAHGMGQGAMSGMQHGQMAPHEGRMAKGEMAQGGWHRKGPGDGSGARHSRHQPLEGKDVTQASVTEFLESRVKRMDNPRLKVGEVTAKDDKVIQGDIVTVDNSIVWRFEFDRTSGRMQPVK